MAARPKGAVWYVGLLAAAFAVGVAASWVFGEQLDNYAYDIMLRRHKPRPWTPQSVILAIDDATLRATQGGMNGIRRPLAAALRLVAAARPAAVADDVILASEGQNPTDDKALADALRATPNLVLPIDLTASGWDHPRSEFRPAGAALGHVQAPPDLDGITRSIPLEVYSGRERYWALALEAYRISRAAQIVETSDGELRVGGKLIPPAFEPRPGTPLERFMRVRFVDSDTASVPRISMQGLLDNPALASQLTNRVVFIGATAAAASDRPLTPYSLGRQINGVEIHADAFETMAQGLFITDVTSLWVIVFSLGVAAAIGLAFRYLPGWRAYAAGALALAAAQVAPYVFFTHQRVFSFATPVSVAVARLPCGGRLLSPCGAPQLADGAGRPRALPAGHALRDPRNAHAAFRHPGIQRADLALRAHRGETQADRAADQLRIEAPGPHGGDFPERGAPLGRADGAEARGHPGEADGGDLRGARRARWRSASTSPSRSSPIAEDLQLAGDRELMEYACYNLLTNAVKYSPQRTEVDGLRLERGRAMSASR